MEAKEYIAALRRRGFTQERIAQLAGLSQGAISHIETGKRKDVRARTEKALARALHDAQAPDERAA